MPLPVPAPGQDKNEFMGQCVSMVMNEDPLKSVEQACGICFAQFDMSLSQEGDVMTDIKTENTTEVVPEMRKDKKPKGKLEILSEFKKMIEKNGLSIDDDALLELYQKFTTKPEDVRQFSLSNELKPTSDLQTIQIFPKKKVFVDKYNEWILFNDKFFDEVIQNFENPKLFKPFIDKDHSLQEKFADIVRLFKNETGLFAEIQLNDLGIDAIKNNKYSYISPEWGSRINTDKELCKNVLWAVTLTNIPALEGELPRLQDQIKLTKGVKMDYREKLASLEGRLQLSNRKLQGEEAADVPGAVIAELVAMTRELLGKMEEAIGAKEQAEEIAMTANEELNTIKNEQLSKEKEEFFTKALKSGQIEPKEKEMLYNQYDASPDFVRKFVLSRDKKEERQLSAPKTNDDNFTLSKEDKEIAEGAGYDVSTSEGLKKFRKEVMEA
jgi:hypothetical protein